MVLWQGILIILGCMVVGLLGGLLLVRLLHRNKEKKPSLLKKEADFIKSEDAKVPVDTTFSNGMTKSNGHEDPLELLIKNHKSGLATEKATQSSVNDVLKREGNVKTKLIIEAENAKQPEAADVLKQEETVKSELIIEAENAKQPEAADVLNQDGIVKSDLVIEMEANLVIASKPWADKLYTFQTKCWDSNHGEFDTLLTTHHRDLMQLYIDIGLANNIVWLATEINHRTKELDESYIRLCSGIADNIKKILL